MMNAKMLVIPLILFLPCSFADTTQMEQDYHDYAAAWTAGDVDKVMSFFTDDIVYEDKSTKKKPTGRAEVREFVADIAKNFAGMSMKANTVTIGKDSASMEWLMSGGSGDGAWSIQGISAIQIKDGKFSRVTDYWHDAAFLCTE